jgi:4-aminobutyrate aminotransferase / (S)-3-amino-2-methylpropionate transaminase / 5-aminovalerate transaminase
VSREASGREGSGREGSRPRILTPPPGPRSRELAARLAAVECPAFDARRDERAALSGADQTPIVFESANGPFVVDVDGNVFVDLVMGFGSLILGHRPDVVTRAVRAQQDELWLALGDVYASPPKIELCERLAALLPEPGARVLLGTTGADAVTAAMKSAVLATGRSRVIAFEGAYHGLSHAPLAACGLAPAFREPFRAQLGDYVDFVPYPRDRASLDACMMQVDALAPSAGAILVEPILGRGGCVVPPEDFLPRLRRTCDASGALLVADEVWTGMGRSGALLASLDGGVLPDLVCVGKGLGGGMPISACIGRAHVMEAWGRHGGTAIHTGTHVGAPTAAAAACAVLDHLAATGLPLHAASTGAQFQADLARATAGLGISVRGRGLMIGLEVGGGKGRALGLVRSLLARGWLVLTGGPAGETITLTPSLTMDAKLREAFTHALAEAARESCEPRDGLP